MANSGAGQWITMNGKHIFIKYGQHPMDAYIRNEYKLKKQATEKNKIISSSEKRQSLLDFQNKREEQEKIKNEKLKDLNNQYSNGKLTRDEYDKKYIELDKEYDRKSKEGYIKTIYDEKNDNYLVLEDSKVFYDSSKDFNTNQNKNNTGNYTDEEKSSLYKYTTSYGNGSYSTINRQLYNKDKSIADKDVETNISNIDSAMSKSKLGGEFQLYRSIEPEYLNNESIASTVTKINKAIKKGGGKNLDKYKTEIESLKGTTIENKGFVSTSTHLDSNYTQRGVTFVINTGFYDRGIDLRELSAYNGGRNDFMSAFAKGNIQIESEVLLDRNTDFNIKDVAITNEGVFLLCETKQRRN